MNGISKEVCFDRMGAVKGGLLTMQRAYEAMNPGLKYDDFVTTQKVLAWNEKVSFQDVTAFVKGAWDFLQKVELIRAKAELSVRREIGMPIKEEFIESKEWGMVFGRDWSYMSIENTNVVMEHEWNKRFPDAGITYRDAQIKSENLPYYHTAPYVEFKALYFEFEKAKEDAEEEKHAKAAEKRRAKAKESRAAKKKKVT